MASEVFECQNDYHHVVHLAEYRDEIRDELDRADDIEECAPGDYLRVPGHQRVYNGPSNDPELFKKSLD